MQHVWELRNLWSAHFCTITWALLRDDTQILEAFHITERKFCGIDPPCDVLYSLICFFKLVFKLWVVT
jgi:hypothetical protein